MRAMESFDVAVIGAGAAGMMCAAVAGQRGRRVLLIDHAERLGEKIRISGGGRCNFTNMQRAAARNFLSANPHFCRSALARYTPRDFIALVQAPPHRVSREAQGPALLRRLRETDHRMLLKPSATRAASRGGVLSRSQAIRHDERALRARHDARRVRRVARS